MFPFRWAAAALALMFATGFAFAQGGDSHAGHGHGQEGGRYSMLNPPQPTSGGGKIEVIEFFWYGCPHCYRLEPAIEVWRKRAPKDVVFKRVPAAPSDSWAQMATVFYTLEYLGMIDQLHPKIFDAMHKEKIPLDQKKARDEWLAKQGIDVAKYHEMEKSFAVTTMVQRAKQLTRDYKVDSVPRLAVHGRYVTTAEQAGGTDAIFLVVDELIALARKK